LVHITLTEEQLMSKILMVLTSHNILGSTGRPTGFWLEEFTAPYYVFEDAGEQVTLASPKGGNRRSTPRATRPPARPRR
jgi:putative intracellular protease/amidase